MATIIHHEEPAGVVTELESAKDAFSRGDWDAGCDRLAAGVHEMWSAIREVCSGHPQTRSQSEKAGTVDGRNRHLDLEDQPGSEALRRAQNG